MKKFNISFAILLLIMTNSFIYSNPIVSGRIITNNNTPIFQAKISFVNVTDTNRIFTTLSDSLGNYLITITGVGVKDDGISDFQLYQNYPNPFSERTEIDYEISKPTQVEINVYNILGCKVRTLIARYSDLGKYTIPWDGRNDNGELLSAGVYFYVLKTALGTKYGKMVYLSKKGTIDLGLRIPNIKPLNQIQHTNISANNVYDISITSTPQTNILFQRVHIGGITITNDTIINIQVTKLGSTDWELLGLEGRLVSNLVFIENYLYATAGRDGLYRWNRFSSNAQWEYLGLADTSIERTLESGVTDVVNAAGYLLVSYVAGYQHQKRGIYRSTDNGLTWLSSDSGMITTPEYPTPSQILCLETSPADPTIVFAGTSVSLVYLSCDGGLSWRQIAGIVGASALNHTIRFNPSKPNEVWVGGESGFFAPYLLHSTDRGQMWAGPIWFPPNIGPYTYDNAVYDIAIDPTKDSILYFGMLGVIAKTKDKGQTFHRVLGWEDGIYPNMRLAMNPENPDELFATGFYLYRTKDAGRTWQRIEPPDYVNNLYALVVDWKRRVLFVSASYPGYGVHKMRF